MECIQFSPALLEANNIKLSWVPEYQGIGGNEKCELKAKKGAKQTYLGPEPGLGISLTLFRHLILIQTKDEHRIL